MTPCCEGTKKVVEDANDNDHAVVLCMDTIWFGERRQARFFWAFAAFKLCDTSSLDESDIFQGRQVCNANEYYFR